jgi:hypothetical protein
MLSHFWWQRNVKGERMGKTDGMRVGRERKVFSRIKAEIYMHACMCVCMQYASLISEEDEKREGDGGETLPYQDSD